MKKPEGKLQELVGRLQQASADNLLSVVLYGSAAREDFHEQYSDVNLLVVFQDLGPHELSAITPVIHWWAQEERFSAPLVMTAAELRESADVFAIELLDIQHTHRTIFGEDLVSSIHVPMNLHRVEVEHELRTALLRLRQHWLLHPAESTELRLLLAKSVSTILTLFRHALMIVGEDPPREKPKVLEHAARTFAFDPEPVEAILAFRHDPLYPVDINQTYTAYLGVIAHLAHELDARAPKRHLQKVTGAA